MPPALLRFSMMTVWLSCLPQTTPRLRPSVSVGPPAANGISMVIGLVGKFCAWTAQATQANATARNKRFMTELLLERSFDDAQAAVVAAHVPVSPIGVDDCFTYAGVASRQLVAGDFPGLGVQHRH